MRGGGGRWEGKPLTEGGKTKNCCLMKIKENCLLFFCSTQKDEISPKMKSESGERENIFLFFLTARNFIKTFLFKSFLIRRVASQKITLPPLPDPKSYLLQLLSCNNTHKPSTVSNVASKKTFIKNVCGSIYIVRCFSLQ